MAMKYIVLVPDGMADVPLPELRGRTPLEAAVTTCMDQWAGEGEVGLAQPAPPGMYPGSDVCNLAIFGFDPAAYYTGRAPLEAANMGIELGDGVAFRCNLVTLANGRMKDFTAGHVSSPEAAEIIKSLNAKLGTDALRFYPGVQYRHILTTPKGWANAPDGISTTPPHDVTDQEYAPHLPQGAQAGLVRELMQRSQTVLKDHPVNLARRARGESEVTSIWLWGCGGRPRLPLFKDAWGVSGAVISAVDLIFGIGRCLGLEIITVPGATGFINTNYEGKAQAALDALERVDLVYVHVEAPDETGHMGDAKLKTRAITDFDQRLCATLAAGLEQRFPRHRILCLPDHPTPCTIKTHSSDPVPYFIYDSTREQDGTPLFNEFVARQVGSTPVPGHELMGRLLRRNPV